jgi:hypothetical protein
MHTYTGTHMRTYTHTSIHTSLPRYIHAYTHGSPLEELDTELSVPSTRKACTPTNSDLGEDVEVDACGDFSGEEFLEE